MTSDSAFNYTYDYNNNMVSSANISTGAVTTYTYDVSGQRLTQTNGTTTTVYISKYYNYTYLNSDQTKTPTQITKHIFAPSAGSGQANNMDIATIQGSGIDAKIYYNHSDLLQNSSVMTDQTGAIAETLDYFPFGEIRLDKTVAAPAGAAGPAALTEQRKFIGQEYDADTSLNYLNARYYNSAISRFISQDPMFWNLDNAWLSDPQTQNAYSYARNNPLIYSDSDGKKAELVVKPLTPIPGAHGFVLITAEKGADLSQYGEGSRYTVGGYPSNRWGGMLQARINESGDLNFPESKYLATYPLAPPEGVSVAQYDQKLLESGADLVKGNNNSGNLGMYVFTGQPISPFPNSGNTATQVIINAGGTVPAINSVYTNSDSRSKYFPLGLGNSLGTQWFILSKAQQAASYAEQKVSQAISSANKVINSVGSTITSTASSLLNYVRYKP